MNAPGRTIDIRAALDEPRVGAFRWRIIFSCWLIAVLDGYDVQSMAFAAPVLSAAWNIPAALMGQLLTAALVGMMLGSLILGRVSDAIGRRPVLLASVALVGIGSLATALCTSATAIMLTRFITGIGIGGVTVMCLSLTAEYAPSRSRAMIVTAMYLGFPIGGSIGGLLATPLISAFGWQAVFWVGGSLPLLVLIVVRRHIPESLQFSVLRSASSHEIGKALQLAVPGYLHRAGDRFVSAEAQVNTSIAQLFAPHLRAGTFLLWLICFGNLLVLYLLINWLPSILHLAGMSLAGANLGAVAFNAGGVVGGLALARTVDKMGAFRVIPITYVATAMIVLLLALAPSGGLALALTIFAGAGVVGGQFCINALLTAYYPTSVRSTGTGWALGVGRIGSITGPLVGGMALGTGLPVSAIFSGLAAPLFTCSVAVVLLGAVWRRSQAP